MIVYVITPSLNKSFKFQSDWPYNNSQVYLLNSILEDLKEDEERTFENKDDKYIFTSKVNYPNNKLLVKQNVYMNSDSKITKVEVIDDDNNVLISMNFSKIEYDKKFDDKYFELSDIINNTEKSEIDNNNDNTNTKNNTNSDSSTNNNSITNNNTTPETESNKDETTSNNGNNNSSQDLNSKETLSIEDIIYPMYLPDNTYLTSQERINTNNGERLILTFGGDKSFTLVEETITQNKNNLIIPVSGEFDFLTDVIGIIGNNSIMWHSNGIEYYLTSNTMETSMLVDIARSISVLPVSK